MKHAQAIRRGLASVWKPSPRQWQGTGQETIHIHNIYIYIFFLMCMYIYMCVYIYICIFQSLGFSGGQCLKATCLAEMPEKANYC